MKKLLLFIFVFFAISSCSRSQLERSGWIPPTYQKSNYMRVSTAAFAIDNSTAEIKYYLEIDLLNKEAGWVIVNFEDPQNRGNFSKKIFPIQPNQRLLKLTSNPVYGVQNFQSYKAEIILSKDRDGKNITDSINQYVRAYRISQKIINHNLIPNSGKRFFVSGKKEKEEYKIKQYSSKTINFFPDEVNSKNFNVINAGFWIYYDIPKSDQYTTRYNNSNLSVRYEYTLNRKKDFTDKVYQRAVLENPEDKDKPFIYESVLNSDNKASRVFHAPLKNIIMGKKYKLVFEFYSDKGRSNLIEKVTQEIRPPIDNTNNCIEIKTELLYFAPDKNKWMCKS